MYQLIKEIVTVTVVRFYWQRHKLKQYTTDCINEFIFINEITSVNTSFISICYRFVDILLCTYVHMYLRKHIFHTHWPFGTKRFFSRIDGGAAYFFKNDFCLLFRSLCVKVVPLILFVLLRAEANPISN